MKDPTVDVWALDDMAAQMQASYPQHAARLRHRAKELRHAQQLSDSQRGGSEWVIRGGDIPSRLAVHFTGNALRWKEIPTVNPGMVVKTINGTTQIHPWHVHSKILLPVGWAIWNKRPPPVATGTSGGGGGNNKPPASPNHPLIDQLQKELERLGGWLSA